jgi:hypothetical protein
VTDQTIKRPGRPQNPRWDAIPIGARITLSECARILGVDRNSLRANYVQPSAPRRLPDNIEVIRDGSTILILRTR